MTTLSSPSQPGGLLARLDPHDHERLGEALRELLAHGSILGFESTQNGLYLWSHQNRPWVEEFAGLLDLKLHWDHQERIVQAVPQSRAFLLTLKLDATLVLLTLWYEFDTALRDRGESPPVEMTVQQLNDSLAEKFEPLKKHLPSQTRLREILSLAQRKNLLRYTFDAAAPERSPIQIHRTLHRAIEFQSIEEWNKNAERYLAGVKEPGVDSSPLTEDGGDDKSE